MAFFSFKLFMEKYSKIYVFLQSFIRFYHNKFWYKQIGIRGFDALPEDTPVIFAPNHQNALMDATAFVFSTTKQVVFLARADIFNSKITSKIFTFMRILPIYRMRDGASSLGKNEEIFNKSVKVLENKHPLGLFPEATHWGFRKLRPTMKGIPRIAFLAEERNDFHLNTVIIPVGIYYDEYQGFRKNLFMNFGRPIKVSDFKDTYLANENQGFLELRKAIERGMKEVMMHIDTDAYYADVENIRTIISYRACVQQGCDPNKIENLFDTDKKTIAVLDALIAEDEPRFLELKSTADTYRQLLDKMKIGKWLIPEGGIKPMKLVLQFFAGVVSLPVVFIGLIMHLPIKLLIDLLVKKIVKDPQFVRSFRFGLAFFLLPISCYLSLLAASTFIELHWAIWVSAFFFMPLTGVAAHEFFQSTIRWCQAIRYRLGLGIAKADQKQAEDLHEFLLQKVTARFK